MLVSIIVPCYQAETYLPECLSTLRSQDFRGMEIICVDDGSTDGTAALLDAAATEDPRVRVWHTENKGVSEARALGLARARGDYVLFVDADDLVPLGAVQELYEAACRERADILSADHEELDDQGVFTRVTLPQEVQEQPEDTEVVLRSLVRLEGFYNTLWNKLITRSLCTGEAIRFFPGVKIGEDVLLNLQLYHAAKHHAHLPRITYGYRRHAASVTGGRRWYFEEHLPMLTGMRDWLRQEGLWETYWGDYLSTCMWLAYKQYGLWGALKAYGTKVRPLVEPVEDAALSAGNRWIHRQMRWHLYRLRFAVVHAWRRARKKSLRQD